MTGLRQLSYPETDIFLLVWLQAAPSSLTHLAESWTSELAEAEQVPGPDPGLPQGWGQSGSIVHDQPPDYVLVGLGTARPDGKAEEAIREQLSGTVRSVSVDLQNGTGLDELRWLACGLAECGRQGADDSTDGLSSGRQGGSSPAGGGQLRTVL